MQNLYVKICQFVLLIWYGIREGSKKKIRKKCKTCPRNDSVCSLLTEKKHIFKHEVWVFLTLE